MSEKASQKPHIPSVGNQKDPSRKGIDKSSLASKDPASIDSLQGAFDSGSYISGSSMASEEDTLETCVAFIEQKSSMLKQKTAVLTLLSGNEKGLVIEIPSDQQLVIGRSKDADVHIKDATISRKHATIGVDGTGSVILTDLNSTNGTFVNEKKVTRAVLNNNDKLRLGDNVYFKFGFADAIDKEYMENLYESAHIDFLTGAHKRDFFWNQFQTELRNSNELNKPLSLMIADIDFFKKINDTYGHPAGDYILRGIVQILSKTIRRGNLVGRYGGEEFIFYLKDTPEDGALIFANRVRDEIEHHPFEFDGKKIQITISIGLTTNFSNGQYNKPAEEMLKEADAFLYKAKQNGRNRVEGKITTTAQK